MRNITIGLALLGTVACGGGDASYDIGDSGGRGFTDYGGNSGTKRSPSIHPR